MSLLQAFSIINDPRRQGFAFAYDLTEIIVCALCAIMAGNKDWVGIADWCEAEVDWLRLYMPLKKRTPSDDTFRRIFATIDHHVFEQCFRQWISGLVGVVDGVIAIDGKTIRGSKDGENSAIHMVNAYATDCGLCLGMSSTKGKGNELAGIKSLIETLSLRGNIVTMDALGCQSELAEKIVEKGGDYVLPVKANQANTLESIKDFFDTALKHNFAGCLHSEDERIDKGHGRIEIRKAYWVNDVSWMDESLRERWANLEGVGMIHRTRILKGSQSEEVVYYIGSKGIKSAEQFGKVVRDHWGVENGLHYVLDVYFGEDAGRMRKREGAKNMAVLKRWVLAQLKLCTIYPGRSLKRKMGTASRNKGYLAKLLGLQAIG